MDDDKSQPPSVREFAAAHRTLYLDLSSQPDTTAISTFRDDFLKGVGSMFSVPCSAFSKPDQFAIYDQPRMKQAVEMIWRAAQARAAGTSGWGRKLKRARRIQREVCGRQTSNLWFSIHWQNATAWHTQRALYRWQAGIYRALMGDAGMVYGFAGPRRRRFDTTPSPETVERINTGIQNHFVRALDFASRPVRGVIIADEIDAFPEREPWPEGGKYVGTAELHPEWYDEDGNLIDDDSEDAAPDR